MVGKEKRGINAVDGGGTVLASHPVNANWIYDISSHSMSMDFISEDDIPDDSVLIEDYKDTIINARLIIPEDEPVFEAFCKELDEGRESIYAEYRAISGDYKQTWIRQTGQTVYDETGKPVRVIGRRLDITREKTLKDGRVVQDVLTGLYHRDMIRELITEAHEKGDIDSAAYILIDIDDYHSINEQFGKMQGDTILQTISGLIHTNFMVKDYVGRIAGDQFLVFCPNIDSSKVKELLGILRKRIIENIKSEDITFSAGVSFYPKDGDSFDVLYVKADIALSKAKMSGKNCCFEYKDEMEEIGLGYTLSKVGVFDEDEKRTSKAASNKVNKKLFDFSFDNLSKENNISDAVNRIFEEVCLYYGLDRAILQEFDKDYNKAKVISRWTRCDDKDDVNIFNSITENCRANIEKAVLNTDCLILEEGRGKDLDIFREIVMLNKVPVSAAVFPIKDDAEIIGYVFFEAFHRHRFEESEIATIKSIIRLIRSYLLSQQVKHVLEMETIINRNVMDAQKTIHYVVDSETYRIKYLSKYAMATFPEAEYGKVCYESMLGHDAPCKSCPFVINQEDGSSIQFYDEDLDRWFTLTSKKITDMGSGKDVLVCVTDVTDLLQQVRGTDTLTVADSFDRFVVTSTKLLRKRNAKYTVVCVGIDHFSKINDEYGYVVGDEVLKRLAELIKADLKEGELLCRIKGDDFVILVENADESKLKALIAKYTKMMTMEFRAGHAGIEINIFAGSYDILDSDEYINHCVDNAMKARNVAIDDLIMTGGYYKYSQEFELKEQEEELLKKKLLQSLKNGNFKVFFQPKVDVNTEQIIGAEALVRLIDDDGKIVSPGVFVPLAEKNGLIVDIDKEVYRQTFAYMNKWHREGKKVPLISVNVSRLHLTDDTLPEQMKTLSDKYSLGPEEIELEITESVFFEDVNRLIDMIKKLKSIGYVISMDDFGSGYSTLNFMKNLPVDVIKIDGGFFMKNAMDKRSKAVISAILQLTQNLEFGNVSEGVETKEQVQFIKEQGGRCVQGYYYYRPMPAEEFEKLI